MRYAKIMEAWVQQRNAEGDGLQTLGPTLYAGGHAVASWLDRADENGAQIALCAPRMGRSRLTAEIREAIRGVCAMSITVPFPVPSPTRAQQAENVSSLVGAWRRNIVKTARSTHYAWGHYQFAQRQADHIKLYAWAFDLPKPKSAVGRDVLARARRNAIASRRKKKDRAPEPSRDMLRALWRGGRDRQNAFLGPVMLRLSFDGKTIETSEGEKVVLAQVPVGLLWGLACECRLQQRPLIWRIVSERPKIGCWGVQTVRADGSIQVGCHSLSFVEIARLAIALGLQ